MCASIQVLTVSTASHATVLLRLRMEGTNGTFELTQGKLFPEQKIYLSD